MVQIVRTNVIDGAAIDDFHVGVVQHCGGLVLTRTTVLSRSQVHGLNTPKRLLDDPTDPDIRFVVFGIYWSKEAGAYTSGGNVNIDHRDSGTTTIASIPAANIRQAAAASGWASRSGLFGLPAAYPVHAGGLQAAAGSRFSGNGGDLTFTVRYVEVEA